MSNKIVVLSKRPSIVKVIHNIVYKDDISPTDIRKTKEFEQYYNQIWKELDVNV